MFLIYNDVNSKLFTFFWKINCYFDVESEEVNLFTTGAFNEVLNGLSPVSEIYALLNGENALTNRVNLSVKFYW